MSCVVPFVLCICFCLSVVAGEYPWDAGVVARRIIDIPMPPNCIRTVSPKGSYALWLRRLPLKPAGSPVLIHTGQKHRNQSSHVAVIDIDIGKRNLQQCADTAIRFRAEYLWSQEEHDKIAFRFTSGHLASYTQWRKGSRPKISGNRVSWHVTARPDSSYSGFRHYLDTVFTYAGTRSLARDLKRMADLRSVRIGDMLIAGGSPGHAVIVVDVCFNRQTGKKLVLLAQGFMPAQSAHIIKNPNSNNPWYSLAGKAVVTPGWTFTSQQLMRF